MKIKILVAAFLLQSLSSGMIAQGIEKKLVKAFYLEDISNVIFNLNSNVKVSHWDESYLRIQLSIQLENGNEYQLKNLVANGRYNFRCISENGTLSIYAPALSEAIEVNDGQKIHELISIEVYAPVGVKVQVKDLAYESLNDKSVAH